MQRQQTVRVHLDKAVEAMTEAGKGEHQVDAVWLMAEVTGMTRSQLQIDGERLLTAEEAAMFDDFITQRLSGKPLQYILGTSAFYGYDFHVNEHVLIPRFETEELVDRAVKWALSHNCRSLIDMCTGSGCIGLTVLKECPDMTGTLVDLSQDALAVADKNRDALGLKKRASLVKSDLFHEIPSLKVDMILSNPPYIVTEVIDTLEQEVKSEEPYMALDGGMDGLSFYRRIASEAKEHLNEHGLLLFEIGHDQSVAVQKILEDEGYHNIKGFRDLSGNDRMVQGMR